MNVGCESRGSRERGLSGNPGEKQKETWEGRPKGRTTLKKEREVRRGDGEWTRERRWTTSGRFEDQKNWGRESENRRSERKTQALERIKSMCIKGRTCSRRKSYNFFNFSYTHPPTGKLPFTIRLLPYPPSVYKVLNSSTLFLPSNPSSLEYVG